MSLWTLDFAQGEGVADGANLADVSDFQEDGYGRGDQDGCRDLRAPPHPDARYRAHVRLITRPCAAAPDTPSRLRGFQALLQ